jgi:type I restriction enzyme, S subunit
MNAVVRLLTDQIDVWTSAETEKRSGRGRGSMGSASVYGVKKLRELILQLAVCGKLVPQDPQDESATELLKRIRIEKAKSGGKPSPAVFFHTFHKLPLGWHWVSFGEIAVHNSGKTLDQARNTGSLRPYITTSNLYWGRFLLEDLREMPIEDSDLERCTARQGDLLICEGGEAGRAAVWENETEVCFQNHVHRARLFAGTSPYYLFRLFEKLNATGEINDFRKGVGISNMSSKSLASIPVPLPPLAEQHRIAAKVDELMALCDQLEAKYGDAAGAHEKLVSYLLGTLTGSENAEDFADNWLRIAAHFDSLFTTEASIDSLKQTILQLAVMGKLVPQDPNDEPAIELLKRLQFAKARLVEEGAIKKDKALAPVSDNEKPFKVPPSWEFARLQSVLDVRDGTHNSPKEAVGQDTYPLVTSKDFENGTINFASAKTISAADHYEISKRSFVEKYDILFSMIGGNIGNQVMVMDDRSFSVKNVAIFKYYSRNMTVPSFIKRYLENLATSLQSSAVGGAQPFIGLGPLRNLVITLPPINEQHRIVAKIDALMAVCDELQLHLVEANIHKQKIADVLVDQAMA